MKKKRFKLFFLSDYDKEERWLNEMSDKGWELDTVSGPLYSFRNDLPEDYYYRLDFVDPKKTEIQRQEYIHFVEEAGAEKIGQYGNWLYFRQRRSLGEFHLYSDLDSRVEYLRRIRRLGLTLALVMLPVIFSNIYYLLNHYSNSLLLGTSGVTFMALVFMETFLISKIILTLNKRIKQMEAEREMRE